jgi:hypothetical protein
MDSKEHQELVKELIEYFTQEGFTVTHADFDNFEHCYKIGRHAPDVIAYNSLDNSYHIGEAETCDSLEDQQTLEQFEDFSNTEIDKTNVQFYALVPELCLEKVENTLRDLGIESDSNVHVLSQPENPS